jgi:hypothetical protein
MIVRMSHPRSGAMSESIGLFSHVGIVGQSRCDMIGKLRVDSSMVGLSGMEQQHTLLNFHNDEGRVARDYQELAHHSTAYRSYEIHAPPFGKACAPSVRAPRQRKDLVLIRRVELQFLTGTISSPTSAASAGASMFTSAILKRPWNFNRAVDTTIRTPWAQSDVARTARCAAPDGAALG